MTIRGVLAPLVLGLMVGTACADEFYLKHDLTGRVFGPYQTDVDSKVVISGTAFTVVRKSEGTTLEQKLGEMKIRHIELRGAPLRDAVRFLETRTRALDPEKEGVTFILAKMSPRTDADSDPSGGSAARPDTGPTVTLSLTDVSALQVLKTLMDQTGYRYKTSAQTVTIFPEE